MLSLEKPWCNCFSSQIQLINATASCCIYNLNPPFAKPYQSWQRGANENLNGLVRQYYPKKSDFSVITEEELKEVENKLNNRPRKRFGYKTPNEIFFQKLKIEELLHL